MQLLHQLTRHTFSAISTLSRSTSAHRRAYSLAFTACQRWPSSISRAAQQSLNPISVQPSKSNFQTRTFSTTPSPRHGHLDKPKPGQERHVTFIDKEGERHTFEVADGDNLLDIAQANELEMEGACGGSCACSTCHIILTSEDVYNQLEEPSDDENDMLDLAFGLTETSRLGCQVVMSEKLDGLEVKLPSMTRNLQASDFASKEKS